MESAIPAHLLVDRTRPRRIPEDYAPPYPSFVARSSPAVRQVVMAYLGLQYRGEPAGRCARRARRGVRARRTVPATTTGPGRSARTAPPTIVSIAYWDDPTAFDRWFAAHRESWLGDAARDGHGRLVEVLRPTVEEHETLFSSLGRPEGVAVLADGFSGEVQEHAYWGGMRDRIPLSQTDPMAPTGAPALSSATAVGCASGPTTGSA